MRQIGNLHDYYVMEDCLITHVDIERERQPDRSMDEWSAALLIHPLIKRLPKIFSLRTVARATRAINFGEEESLTIIEAGIDRLVRSGFIVKKARNLYRRRSFYERWPSMKPSKDVFPS